MLHLDSIVAMRDHVQAWRESGIRTGFVPTMGALHRGHLSLVEEAHRVADQVVVSIFVNPTQFGPNEDLASYPRDLEGDLQKLRGAGCDAVFTTSPEVMYPEGFATWVNVEGLTDVLCGASRPGHFRGVTTVVMKLLQIVQPHTALFGEKDRQQLIVIERMVRDLDVPVLVHGCPIVREPDGLALSSRNLYLDPPERRRALALSRGLRRAREAFARGERGGRALEALVRERLTEADARIDYVQAVDPRTLRPVERAEDDSFIAVAAYVGSTRLIDNHVLGEPFPAIQGEAPV